MKKRFVRQALTMLLAFAMVFTMIPLLGISTQESDAATETVTIGKFDGDNVTADNNIVLPAIDLTKETTSTYRMGVQYAGGLTSYNQSVAITNEKPSGGFHAGNELYRFNNYVFTLTFDAANLTSGTYTADVVINVGKSVIANGGKYKSSGNSVTVPVSVTVTGNNSSFENQTKSISVKAGNKYNDVSWMTSDGCNIYRVYRRDGKDANASSPELSRYSLLAEVYTAPDIFDYTRPVQNPVVSDHSVENGKTYSYIVISGEGYSAFQGNPSKSVFATPGTSVREKPAPPYAVSGYSDEDASGVSWSWDTFGGYEDPSGKEPESTDGKGVIDHFNVYLNGRLYKQVQQNVIYSGSWDASLALKTRNADYTVWVTAVDYDGNESIPSGMVTLRSPSGEDVIIDSHRVYYYEEDWETGTGGLMIGILGYGIESYEFWKKPAGSSDSSYSKVALKEDADAYEEGYRFFYDKDVTAGKAYTYKVVGHARDGRVSDPYVLSVADNSDDEEYEFYYVPGGENLDLSLRTSDGESVTAHAYNCGEGTYRLYRNGAVINTWTNYKGDINYTDVPPSDGTYKYHLTWTSRKYPSLTTRSNDAYICRDTSAVDPDDLEKAPGAPKLSGRINDSGNVVMSWTPDKKGGDVQGYIIYRTDNDVPNEFMWHNTWIHPLMDDDANGRYISRNAETTSYEMSMAWNRSQSLSANDYISPHKLWVVAYNEMGVSKPSNVLVYSDDNGRAPAQTDESVPGAPENVSAWYEWDDRSGEDIALKGNIYVSWENPSEGASVSEFIVRFVDSEGKSFEMTKGTGSGAENRVSVPIAGDVSVGETYTITVSAKNKKGSTSAAPVTVKPESTLSFNVKEKTSNSALLTWWPLHDDITAVKQTNVMRRSNKSAWAKVDLTVAETTYEAFQAVDDSLTPGTTYEYYISVVDINDKVHNSAIKSVTTSSRTDPAGAPSNLSARSVDGDVILSWDPPTEGSLPIYYVLEYQTTDKDPSKDSDWQSLNLIDDTFGKSTGASIKGYDWAPNNSGKYKQFGTFVEGKYLNLRVRAKGYNSGVSAASAPITFKWPTREEIAIRANAPTPVTPTIEEGDGKVTISWNKKTDLSANESEATYYELVRRWDSNKQVIFTIPVVQGKTAYTYVDDDTDIENGRQYSYILRACSSYRAVDAYGNKYWYSPLCDLHVYTAVPNGKTSDQLVAENITNTLNALYPDYNTKLANAAYRAQVRELEGNYEGLTSYQKKLINAEDLGKIEELIAAVNNYEATAQYQDQINAVIATINALTNTSSEDEVKAARAAYDRLPEIAKPSVTNYNKLTDAEARIKQQKQEQTDTEIAGGVTAKLEAIDLAMMRTLTYETLTDEIQRNIANLRWEYDQLTAAQKAKVSQTGKNNLAEAEQIINDIKQVGHVHDLRLVGAREATCTQEGNIKYYKCRKCNKLYTDEEAEKEIAEAATVIPVDASNHDWTDWTVQDGKDASCTKGGIDERDCRLCHAHEERTFTARNHTWDDGVVTTPATDDTEGVVTFTCKACNATRIASISANNSACTKMSDHRWGEGVETVKATCQQHGQIKYTCMVCGTAIKIETEIDPLAHTWKTDADTDAEGWKVVTPASCTNHGKAERVCKNAGCTEKETKITETLGHDWEAVDDPGNKPATCAEAGSQKYKCKRDGCNAVKTEVIPALKDHNWGEWNRTVEPTCTEAGVEERTCDKGHYQFRPVDPLGHDMSGWTTIKAATCTSNGERERHCERDGCDYSERETLRATGHNWSSWTSQQPTEESQGVVTHRCNRCGSTYYTAIAPITLPTDLPYVKASKPAKGKKAITVKWKKVSKKNQKKIGGIEVQVTGPGVDTVVTAGKKKSSKKIKGLMPKQVYSCRVRAYNYIGGVKHVSAWSNWKTAKTK